jgi:thiosulfate reductase/polysulfide reductase chain A
VGILLEIAGGGKMAEQLKRAICGLCASHCRYKVRVEDDRFLGVDYRTKQQSPVAEMWRKVIAGCPRAVAAPEFLYHPDRLNYPLKRVGRRGENQWQRVTWEQALDEIAEKLKELRDNYGAEALAITTSGEQNSAEEYRVRFQSLFGTPNYLGPSTCGVSFLLSHLLTGWMDFMPRLRPETRCFLLLGVNSPAAGPMLWKIIREARKGGLKLIVVDPRGTDMAMAADLWLQPKPGTDAALLLAMVNTIISERLYDQEFVTSWCYGFEKLVERVREYPPEKVTDITWVPAEKIREAARMYATNKPAAAFHANGLEEQPRALSALHLRYILPAITGNLDIMGGDVLMEPHPRARLAADIELIDKMPAEQQEKRIGGKEFKLYSWAVFEKLRDNVRKVRETPPTSFWITGTAHAPSVFRAMINGNPYPVKALITVAKNPLLSFPNTKLVYEALTRLDLHVAMDVFMTPTCRLADYVLPAACFFEKPTLQGGDYDLYLQGGEAAVTPMYERKPEYYFWRELGVRLGQEEYWPWKTLEEAYDYRLAPLGITFKEFMAGKGYDNPPTRHRKYEARGFGTPTGKFEIYSTILEELGYDPLPSYKEPVRSLVSDREMAKEFPLILISGSRNRRYYHSQGRQLESLRKRDPDPIAQINPEAGSELGIKDGDWMWIETPVGRVRFKCKYFRGIDPHVVQAEHGWWFPEEPSLDALWQSNINAVLDDAPELCDPVSGNFPLRGQLCRVHKAED